MKKYKECKECPHIVGDSFQRDCAFPECCGGWEAVFDELMEELIPLRELAKVIREVLYENENEAQ